MKRYPAYKTIGLAGLAEIPAHWEAKRAKFLLREVIEPSEVGDEELLSVSHITGVTRRSEKNVTMFMAESYEGFKTCQPGDLVINTMWAWMGALGVSPLPGIVSSSYGVYRLRNGAQFNPRYLDLLLRTRVYVAEYTRRSTGINSSRLRLYPEDFFDVAIIQPPIEEQDAIVAFLDHKLADIDCFIRNKERLIELLQEQKMAIINHAVTRGLNPTVTMKPSGVEWLGEMPGHWEVRALKQMAKIHLSGVDKHSSHEELPVSLCNYTDVYNCDFITRDLDFMPATATQAEIVAFTLHASDVLITKDSESWNDIAVPALVRGDIDGVLCGYHLALIRPDHDTLTGEYLFRAFSAPALAYQFNVAANGVTRYGLSKHAIKNALFPLPPVEEQQQICRWIAGQLQPIRSSVEGTKREIDLLREYRTAVIAEAVTGKIDFRSDPAAIA